MNFETTFYLAKFTPQAWLDGHAVDVDAMGIDCWDVSAHIHALARQGSAATPLRLEEAEVDTLRDVGNPPEWVQRWGGPFRISVVATACEDLAAKLLGLPEGSSLLQAVESEALQRPDAACDPDCARRSHAMAECDCSRSDNTAPAADSQRCTCPSGDGSLSWPCPSHPPSVTQLSSNIPDSDGRYGRGYRDALESLALAVGATGKLTAAEMATAVQSALDAYGNHDQRDPKGYEVDESLVVSTAHLTAQERAALLEGELPDNDGQFAVVSMTGQYGALLYLSTPDDELQLPTYGISEGLLGVIEQARKLGAAYVRFDRDAFVLAGVPTYDD